MGSYIHIHEGDRYNPLYVVQDKRVFDSLIMREVQAHFSLSPSDSLIDDLRRNRLKGQGLR